MLATSALLLAGGCGGKSYETRLDRNLDLKRYTRRLDENVQPAAKGKLEPNLIFVRPPLNMEGPTKEFAMTVLEPGRFDVAESFVDPEKKSSLHVLARIPRPKTPAGKKAAAPNPSAATSSTTSPPSLPRPTASRSTRRRPRKRPRSRS